MVVGAEVVNLKQIPLLAHEYAVAVSIHRDLRIALGSQGVRCNAFVDGSLGAALYHLQVVLFRHIVHSEAEGFLKALGHNLLEIIHGLILTQNIRLHLSRIEGEQRIGFHRVTHGVQRRGQKIIGAKDPYEGRLLAIHQFLTQDFHLTGHQHNGCCVGTGIPFNTHMSRQLEDLQQLGRIIADRANDFLAHIATAAFLILGGQIFCLAVSKFILILKCDHHISGMAHLIFVKSHPEGFIDRIGFTFGGIQRRLQLDICPLAGYEIDRNDVFRVIVIGEHQFLLLVIHDLNGSHNINGRG